MKKDFDNLKFITIWGLIIISIIFIEIYTLDNVKAYEVMYPTESQIVNGVNYYGYDLPTRLVDPNDNYSNYVNVGIVDRTGNRRFQNKLKYHRFFDLGLQTSVWTDDINSSWLDDSGDTSADYMTLSFHPTANISGTDISLSDSLNGADTLDYSQYYSYSYYIYVTKDNNRTNGNLQAPYFNAFGVTNNNLQSTVLIRGNNNCRFSVDNIGSIADNSRNCAYNIHKVYDQDNTIVYQYDLVFNNYVSQYNNMNLYKFYDGNFFFDSGGFPSYSFKFDGAWLAQENASTQGVDHYTTNNATIGYFDSSAQKYFNYKFMISQPFNIKLWTTESSLTCSDRCWTQSDTDNNNFYDYDAYHTQNAENLINEIFSLHFLEDFGLFGVVEHIYNKIQNLLTNNYNNACYSYNITIFGKDLHIMCGYDFWSRSDVQSFYNLYSVFWIAFIGFWVVRGVYLKIVDLFNIDDDITHDGKEVSKL